MSKFCKHNVMILFITYLIIIFNKKIFHIISIKYIFKDYSKLINLLFPKSFTVISLQIQNNTVFNYPPEFSKKNIWKTLLKLKSNPIAIISQNFREVGSKMIHDFHF